MPIRNVANVTLKYWHLDTNNLVFLNLLPFIVVVIALVTIDQVYLAVTLFVIVQLIK